MREYEEEELKYLFDDTPLRERKMGEWVDGRIRQEIEGGAPRFFASAARGYTKY